MLISDHDRYDGYRCWRKNIHGKKYKDFVVLKGVEYDTVDGGLQCVRGRKEQRGRKGDGGKTTVGGTRYFGTTKDKLRKMRENRTKKNSVSKTDKGSQN